MKTLDLIDTLSRHPPVEGMRALHTLIPIGVSENINEIPAILFREELLGSIDNILHFICFRLSTDTTKEYFSFSAYLNCLSILAGS